MPKTVALRRIDVRLTHADIIGDAADVNICNVPLLQFFVEGSLALLVVVPEHAVGIRIGVRALVHEHGVLDDLEPRGRG